MTETTEEKVINRYRESLARDQLPADVTITYRVTGGMPSERVEEEVVLKGDRQVTARSLSMLETAMPQEATEELSPEETRELLEQVGSDIEGLVTRENARFVPDSLVGTITIEVDGEEATFYFPIEEEAAPELAAAMPSEQRAIRGLSALSERMLGKDEVDDE